MISIALYILFAILAVSTGAYFFDLYKLKFSSKIEFLLFSYAIGLGLITFIIFLFGITGILYHWTIYVFLILLSLISIPMFYRGARQVRYNALKSINIKKYSFISWLLMVIIGVYAGLNLVEALAPPLDNDSLVYHLANPKRFLEYHRLMYTQIPGVDVRIGPVINQVFELLYVIPLSFHDDIFAKILQYGTALFAGLAIYALSARFFSKLAGLFAMAIFLIQPFVIKQIATPKIDMAIVLYAILSMYAFLEWYDSKESKWIILCGILSGFYMACKLSGLFLIIILSVLIVYRSFRDNRSGFKASLFELRKFLISVVIVQAPWLLRSLILTGDPIYPFIKRFLGNPFETYLFHDKSWISFIKYPWDLTFVPETFLFERSISPFYLAVLPALFLCKNINRKIKYLLIIGLSFIYFFFFIQVQSRYFVAGIAALSIVAGYIIDQFTLNYKNNYLKKAVLVFLCMPFIVNLYFIYRSNNRCVSVVLKRVSRDDYIERALGDYYTMAKYINKKLPEDSVVFAPWEPRFYYFDKRFISGNWMVEKMLLIKSPEEWVKVLKEDYKADYLFLNGNYHNVLIEMYETRRLAYDPRKNLLFSEEMKKYLEPIYSKGKCALYKLL